MPKSREKNTEKLETFVVSRWGGMILSLLDFKVHVIALTCSWVTFLLPVRQVFILRVIIK